MSEAPRKFVAVFTQATMWRLLWVLTLCWAPASALAQDAFAGNENHALQLGAGAIFNGYWAPVPGVRGDLTWLRRYNQSHGYFLRLEGGGSLKDKGDEAEVRAYTASLVLGMREWLGSRQRGFVEVGARLGAVIEVDKRSFEPVTNVYMLRELLTVSIGVALGRQHDVDLLFTASLGFPAGGGLALRVPLWHRWGVNETRPSERQNARGRRPPSAERMKQGLTSPRSEATRR